MAAIEDDLDKVIEYAREILNHFQSREAREDGNDLVQRPQALRPHTSASWHVLPSGFTTINSQIGITNDVDVVTRGLEAVEIPWRDLSREVVNNPVEWSQVIKVLHDVDGTGLKYSVRFGDNHEEMLTYESLLGAPNGKEAIEKFQTVAVDTTESSSEAEVVASSLQRRGRALQSHYPRPSRSRSSSTSTSIYLNLQESSSDSGSVSDMSDAVPFRSARSSGYPHDVTNALRSSRTLHGSQMQFLELEESSSSDDSGLMLSKSDVKPRQKRRLRQRHDIQEGRSSKRVKSSHFATRHSERTQQTRKNMREVEIDQIYRSSSSEEHTQTQPKVTLVREVFKAGVPNSTFRLRHTENCETCGKSSSSDPLVCCQGCSLAYHKACLGNRSTREHLVTKVAEQEFVLQCRRCVEFPRKKDRRAPHLGRCQICRDPGASCTPFRRTKTSLQEQKERDENDGQDPITSVSPALINSIDGLLFRCVSCWRGFHFHCLPNRDQYHQDLDTATQDDIADNRYNQYRFDWLCEDCANMPADVGGLVAWRPVDSETTYGLAAQYVDLDEEDKEYLIKWKELSYARSEFMPGAWVWGITVPTMRIAFAKRESGPKPRIEDAIPEEYLRIDIVLDVEYTNCIDIRTEEVDKARIKEVKRAYMKYKGLGYEDAVWEVPPTTDEGDRWTDFVTAYNDWVFGQWIKLPEQTSLRVRTEKAREQPFDKLEKNTQPSKLIGGEMMRYQIEGLNWLYYRWHQKQNGILADEMGLGKTIQVIAFLAMMLEEHNCCPFLVVVPNSTCPNWRREIKKWSPFLRVVTYYGSSVARDLSYKYEMFPEGSKDLKAHVVVTSYEAARDESCRTFFKSVQWQGLIVDEGQRLKNDRSLLNLSLKALKVPYRILLTGTPLQNNAKELFNLLEFLDDKINAQQLEEEYAEMDDARIRELHDLIRPFILRRTKAGVLSFLPPMAQIIVPVSMNAVQKTFYKSILRKNPELLKSLFSRTAHGLGKVERANLNNVLMQLRKCLCHPFVYSREIEERNLGSALLHRNLVDASSKLQLLDILLPKLKERGHRVLIFSQFLDMLDIVEDVLDGLGMKFNRLDGQISSLEKQKRIDQFNQSESDMFAFLLSTRSGGVGINLATADTVIILDPDFNPHQDIQALSRAHRIGQKKKVLCFQLMTRSSVEEKIMQIGRKKMALDHVIVEQLDADEADEKDLGSILRHGAAELFNRDDSEDHQIKYDSASVDKLLDRSQIENTRTGEDKTVESQFSFARVWANESGALEDDIQVASEELAPDTISWNKILKDRELEAAADAAARQQVLGRGKRTRLTVDYGDKDAQGNISNAGSAPPQEAAGVNQRGNNSDRKSDDSDTDFQPEDRAETPEMGVGVDEVPDLDERASERPALLSGIAGYGQGLATLATQSRTTPKRIIKPFERAQLKPARLPQPVNSRVSSSSLSQSRPVEARTEPPVVFCPACTKTHHQGSCPLKLAGVEYCNLCGLAHYGIARTCPHINSETQVVLMIEAIKNSRELPNLREAALKYLRGVKGTLVAHKKKLRERALARDLPTAHGRGRGLNQAFHGAHAGFPIPVQTRPNPLAQSTAGRTGAQPFTATAGMPPSSEGMGYQAPVNGQQSVESRLLAALSAPQ